MAATHDTHLTCQRCGDFVGSGVAAGGEALRRLCANCRQKESLNGILFGREFNVSAHFVGTVFAVVPIIFSVFLRFYFATLLELFGQIILGLTLVYLDYGILFFPRLRALLTYRNKKTEFCFVLCILTLTGMFGTIADRGGLSGQLVGYFGLTMPVIVISIFRIGLPSAIRLELAKQLLVLYLPMLIFGFVLIFCGLYFEALSSLLKLLFATLGYIYIYSLVDEFTDA